MTANTCPSLDIPRDDPHLEAHDQCISHEAKANPVLPVCAPKHAQDQAYTYRFTNTYITK